MAETYNVTGINLKATPFGESDRLMTILTRERGIIKAVAPGARKPQSSLAGRTSLFVVNKLAIARGKSLARITQAETEISYRNLGSDLNKLAASQYLAELIVHQLPTELPQSEVYDICLFYIDKIHRSTTTEIIFANLCQGIWQILNWSGVSPDFFKCIYLKKEIEPDFNMPGWWTPFDIHGGGLVSFLALQRNTTISHSDRLLALELFLIQLLPVADLDYLPHILEKLPENIDLGTILPAWQKIESLLRKYIRIHLNTHIKSAQLLTSPTAAI
jgi:DNA repair protein RecO (recombination protein O)